MLRNPSSRYFYHLITWDQLTCKIPWVRKRREKMSFWDCPALFNLNPTAPLEKRLNAAFQTHQLKEPLSPQWQGIMADNTAITYMGREAFLAQLKKRNPGFHFRRVWRKYEIGPLRPWGTPYYQVSLTAILTGGGAAVHGHTLDAGYGAPEDFAFVLAKGLFKMGEEVILEELERKFGQQLSFHDKLACRDEMPREFWPQSWMNL